MDSRGYIRPKGEKKINLQIQALQLHFLQDYISQDHPNSKLATPTYV
jgi:hypothetical protein